MQDLVSAAMHGMCPSERRVAQLLLDHQAQFVALSCSEIADRCHVSKPTVVRFCQRLGYSGLRELRLRLQGRGITCIPFVHPAIVLEDSSRAVLVKVVDHAVSAILKFQKISDHLAFENAATALERAHQLDRTIDCYGIGNSSLVAQDAQQKISSLGCNAVSSLDHHQQLIRAVSHRQHDVMLLYSASGRARELIDIADASTERGATVVAVTATGSPLADRSDIHIAADHMEDVETHTPMVSRILHAMATDILVTRLALRLGAKHLEDRLSKVQCLGWARYT